MPNKKSKKAVIAICIQEPFEDGSSMDFGAIEGDHLRFVHQAFITDTINHSLNVAETDIRLYHVDIPERKHLVDIVVDYVSKKAASQKQLNFDKRFSVRPIEKNRWGIRVEQVFKECFEDDYESVLVVGSRTPTFSSEQIGIAINMLNESDAVFGPTPDGRYYAIGMSGMDHILLSEFDWKSPTIYKEVAQTFTDRGLSWSELQIWYAVETTDDLEFMVRDINQFRFEGNDKTALETEKVIEHILAKLEE